MAEAAGLTLGGIALASLFSTCVEMLEYFDEGKHWAQNLQLALTKVNLLKQRLSQWGTTMLVDAAEAEVHTVRERWPKESGVIIDSLLGIRGIMESVTQIGRRYRCGQDEIGRNGCLKMSIYPSATPPHSQSVLARLLSSGTLRLRILWVLQDRRRFDGLISDLDFLLSSLEKISEQLQGESEIRGEAQGGTLEPTITHHFTPHASTATETMSSNSYPNGCKENEEGKDVVENLCTSSYSSYNPTGPESASTSAPYSGQHLFLNNGANDDALLLIGDWSSNSPRLELGHRFEGNTARNNSVMVMGNMDGSTAMKMVSEKLARRAEEKLRERYPVSTTVSSKSKRKH